MARTGRSNYVATSIIPFGEAARLSPPAGLGEGEKRAFIDLVTSCPVDQFQACDLPLLCRWAETVALAERMSVRLSLEGELDEKGKPSGAFTIHKEATKTLNALALRLRISPQARMQKAPRREMREVSYYERLQLELNAQGEEGQRDDDSDDG
jgi:hypothetical protein